MYTLCGDSIKYTFLIYCFLLFNFGYKCVYKNHDMYICKFVNNKIKTLQNESKFILGEK